MPSRTKTPLYIFGAGGFGREVAWLARTCWGEAVELLHVVDRPEYLCGPVNGIPVLLLSSVEVTTESNFVVALGDPVTKEGAARVCAQHGLIATSIVHPRIDRSPTVSIADGAVVCSGTILTTNIRIEKHVQINISCTIGHDVTIGAYSTVSPGVHISGHVQIGKGVFIGTGANIINGTADAPLTIGDRATIAAGACVTRTVEPAALMAGVPAMRKR